MHEEIIIAGFGGQGVLLTGKLLCVAAMSEGKYVSHIPSYGAEMRGGTANCQVVVASEEVASPLVNKPSIVIVLNKPSLTKFEPRLREGGLLIWNESLIDTPPSRTDIEVVSIKANHLSEAKGSTKAANMAALGKLVKTRPELSSLESIIKALDTAVSARNKKFNPTNIEVLKAGYGE